MTIFTKTKRNSEKCPKVGAEPPHLIHDFDLLDLLHNTHGHTSSGRIRQIVRGMQMDDPCRPTEKAITPWIKYRKCRACCHADLERPRQSATHPATRVRHSGKLGCSTHLTIDASGAFKEAAKDGEVQSFLLTDVYTSYRVIIPTWDKKCNTLLNEVRKYIAHVGNKPDSLSIRSIHTDNEFMCSPLREYCIKHGIKLTSCAPHTHQGNAVSETTVKMVKRVVRRNEHKANTGSKLRAYCWVYAGVQLNHTPSSTDPAAGRSRSPCTRWPDAPYHHA
jgi:hypothetical protein